jgi:hypothetical protein
MSQTPSHDLLEPREPQLSQTHCSSLSDMICDEAGEELAHMFISNATTHKTRKYKTSVCTHFLRGACLYGHACTFAHGDDELQASDCNASSSGPGAAPVQISRRSREDCAVRQFAAPLPRPLLFEPHGSIFSFPTPASASPNNDFIRDPREHSPTTTKRALSNYEAFHGLTADSADVLEVARSSAGVPGWAAWAPPLAQELPDADAVEAETQDGWMLVNA